MALVVDRIGFFKPGEAAVLRLKSGLEVGAVIERMRPGVAGEELEVVPEAFLNVDRERVVPGGGVGNLRVNAVIGNWYAEANLWRMTGWGRMGGNS